MMHRRIRTPQTGATNLRSHNETAQPRTHWRKQSAAELKQRLSETDGKWLNTVLPSHCRKDHPLHTLTDDLPAEMTHAKSQANILSRTCLYKDDIQNTKVIYFDNSKEHNAEKMKDIKQIIQRKYANRKKIYNIFAEWDKDHRGEISVENAREMMNSMGIDVDEQEASQFVRYVSQQKNAITLNDFLGMLYEPRPKSVFEKSLKQVEKEPPQPIYNRNRVMALLKEKQKEIYRLMGEFKDSVTFERFQLVLERAGAKCISELESKNIYNYFAKDQRFLQEANLLNELNIFVLDVRSFEEDQPKNMDSKTRSLVKYKHINFCKENLQDVNRVDVRKMKSPELESNIARAERFKNRIRKFIGSRERFEEISDRLLPQGSVVTVEQLRLSMINLMKSVSEPVRLKELEGFLNMFVLNSSNQTSKKDVARIIYEEHALNYYQRVDHQPRSIPPEGCSDKNQAEYTAELADELLPSRILSKIGNSMIFSAGRTLQEFRKLDDNHDGYVESTKLIDKIAVKSGLLKEESEQLRGWMHGTNKENLNYVDFTKFVKFLSEDQNTENSPCYLSKPKRIRTDKSQRGINLDPRSTACTALSYYDRINTRLGATPLNTSCPFRIQNHNDDWGAAGDFNCKIEFQRYDKQRQDTYQKNRLRSIQRYRCAYAERLSLIDQKAQRRYSENMQRFAEQQWAYNHVNHLKNEWK